MFVVVSRSAVIRCSAVQYCASYEPLQERVLLQKNSVYRHLYLKYDRGCLQLSVAAVFHRAYRVLGAAVAVDTSYLEMV